MSDRPDEPDRTGLNPSLRSRTETTHDTSKVSRPPLETTSVQREEGRSWPLIWLGVTIVGVLIVIYLVVW